jgi:predicted protein tyrosine phosphatase
MIKSIQHCSYEKFKQLKGGGTHAFISIRGSTSDDRVKYHINKKTWHSGIMMIFDDVDHPTLELQAITPEQCRYIINYVTEIHRSPQPILLIVHCFAGISRSAAVAKWVSDAFNINLPQYHNRLLHNTRVYSELMKEHLGGINMMSVNDDRE